MRPDPSALARQTCVRLSLFSPSMTDWVCVQTQRRPSGEGTGAVTVFTFIESSGVHCAHRAAGSSNRRVLADIFFHPIQVALGHIENEFRFLESVRLARIDHH